MKARFHIVRRDGRWFCVDMFTWSNAKTTYPDPPAHASSDELVVAFGLQDHAADVEVFREEQGQ